MSLLAVIAAVMGIATAEVAVGPVALQIVNLFF